MTPEQPIELRQRLGLSAKELGDILWIEVDDSGQHDICRRPDASGLTFRSVIMGR
jgi:hypothetical protein